MIIEILTALLILTLLEIVLGIDNIVFISILSQKFPKEIGKKLMRLGLLIAMVTRILFLFMLLWLNQMQEGFFAVDSDYFSTNISIKSLILFLGGLFLIYKGTKEIYSKVEGHNHQHETKSSAIKSAFSKALVQVVLIDMVFSFDSILTAIGMTNGIEKQNFIIIASIIIAIGVMLIFANSVSNIISRHPSLQVLALSFLILIGFLLVTEAAHVSNTIIMDTHVNPMPKGYLYSVIVFSLVIEAINLKIGSRKKKS
ncbi:MAG: TerC family protein [Flavobacteriaceae bacterium]|nr:TerC family protein [Flavobacteriaceae bacterium]